MKRKKSTESYLLLFLILLLVMLGIFASDFYSINNLMSTLNYFSYLLIGAIGMNLIIITSNIDVSAGAIVSVVSIAIAFVGKTGVPIYVFLPVGMVVGMVLSLANGLLITKLRIPAMVATLATTQLFNGILPLLVEGSIYDLPASYTALAFKAKLFGIIPASLVMAVVITIIAMLFMKYSRFSKKLYALGNNMQAARLNGINIDKVVIISYVIAGALYAVEATIIATAGQRVTTTMGNGFEMMMIAAVLLGGTSIAGGSGHIYGTVMGALILSIITPAMNYVGLSSDWSDAVIGVIIILAVVVSELSKVSRTKKSVDKAGEVKENA